MLRGERKNIHMPHPAHQAASRRTATEVEKRRKHTVDIVAYAVGIGGNFAVIPQIMKAWQNDAPGLAVLTWLFYIGIGATWLVYAIVHRQKPLLVAPAIGLTASVLVVAGWVVNNWLR